MPAQAAQVREALTRVVDPCSIATGVPINLLDMGLVQELRCDGDAVHVVLRLTSPLCFQVTNIIEAVQREVGALDGVGSVTCEVDAAAEWWPDMIAPDARAQLRRIRPLPARPS